ncbi:MAG: PIN domain-containing protein [Nocardioides sp.]
MLDSTVLIDYLRGRPAVARVARLIEAGDVPATTALNVEEIVRGLLPGEHEAIDSLIAGLVVLPIHEDTARAAGEWRRRFSARGVTLAPADVLIAAATVLSSGTLMTGNPRDFPMPELDMEHWPVGE